ncbi:MAG: HEAT repeat domain-containing protein [Planctomycetota bacterium]|jgi:pimeloyl-ACP methyl ester carboxylesterase
MRSVLLVVCAALAAAAGPAAAPDDDAAIAALIRRCGDASLADREQAFLELLERATVDDLPQLSRALQEAPRTRSRTRVARVIGRLDAEACVEPLLHALRNDKSEHARAAAAHALGDLRNRRAAGALIQALTADETTRVRKRAAASLRRIGGMEAARALRAAAKDDPNWDVRRAIKWVLEDKGPEATRPARVRPGKVTAGAFRGTRYQIYVPKGYRSSGTNGLLVLIHGTDGYPQGYLEMCRADAEARGLVVVAPWFDWPTFPNFGMLNPGWGNVRADLRLLEIVDHLAQRVSIRSDRFALFGHSQGGAFVQRFALVHPGRVRHAAASAANSFASADPGSTFPYGTGPNPMLPDLDGLNYAPYVQTPLLVVVGEKDEPRFLERAHGIADAARGYAEQHGLTCAIELLVLPDTGHDGKAGYLAAREFLLAVETPPAD